MTDRESAIDAVQRALIACVGPAGAEQLALAQARLAWSEVVEEAGLERGPLRSRLVGVAKGIAGIEASDPALAQELHLRSEAMTWAVNRRMAGRPGATIVLRGLAVSVGRWADSGSL